ncbi:hypothetical protein KW803_03825 [Candidatus Saccharibacteria bacterium]|nr:hypothetical protein [Candidatus Saccharibacteria bacterium]
MSTELSREQIEELPEMDVAMTLLLQVDEYILQYRDPKTENGAQSLIGAFGGKVEEQDREEDDEENINTGLNAAKRELLEETGLDIALSDFHRLGNVHVVLFL